MTVNETQPLPPEEEVTPMLAPNTPAGEMPSDDDRLWAAAGYVTQFVVPWCCR